MKNNFKLQAWTRYFKTAIQDLKVTTNKEVKKDIQGNIIKKLNQCKEIFSNNDLQEILILFTESNTGIKKIKKHDFSKDTFVGIKQVINDYTKLGGGIEIKTSLKMINRNEYNTFIATLRVSL